MSSSSPPGLLQKLLFLTCPLCSLLPFFFLPLLPFLSSFYPAFLTSFLHSPSLSLPSSRLSFFLLVFPGILGYSGKMTGRELSGHLLLVKTRRSRQDGIRSHGCVESIWMALHSDNAGIPDLEYVQPQLCHFTELLCSTGASCASVHSCHSSLTLL